MFGSGNTISKFIVTFVKVRWSNPNVLEVGVYSGESLEMWHSYFGEGSHIYGVDIEPACKAYESDHAPF